MNVHFPFENNEPVTLLHPEINPLNTYTNILLIDNSVEDFQIFVDSANTSTFPIVYSVFSLKTDLLALLQTNFQTISRIGIVFTSSLESPKMFLDFKPLFLNDEPVSENLQFIIDVINEFQVKNIDYLACNTLNYPNYVTYYDTIKTDTGVVVGASNDKTGNIKYGGNWIMESTGQDIELIYFTHSIEYYTYLLDATYSTGSSPYGIVLDSVGNIYTVNFGNNNVTKITPGGASTIFGNTGIGPQAILIDSAGNIYTANSGTNNVTKITTAGISTIFGTTGLNPVGITIDSAGNIYTANKDSNNVTKITTAGISTIFGTTGSNPMGIAIDFAGNIYTANYTAYYTTGDNITKITPAGISTNFDMFVTGFPTAITIDSAGNIYTSNFGYFGIDETTKTTPEGVSAVIGVGKSGNNTRAITVDSAGNVYAANSGSNSVTKITPVSISTIHGTTYLAPVAITIDSAGNIYTANQFSNNVTKITPQGASTIFGNTGSDPMGITIDSAGNIYTANFSSNNVTQITPAGVSYIFGTTCSNPIGIAIDSAGNIYTSNQEGNNVTKITAYTFTISPSAQIAAQIATVSNAFSGYSLTYTGPNASYTISPNLPAGLSFGRTTGLISGTPLTVSPETTYTITSSNVLTTNTYTLTVVSYICFKEGSKILTDKGYIPIQDLRKGDLVKTLENGFLEIESIGKRELQHICCKERIKEQLYQCSNDAYPEVFEPLILTGCHSILVDDFTSDEQRENTFQLLGDIYITDNKYRLPACVDHRASVYETPGTYDIYHLALKNDNYYMNYGIYANGLLVETCSLRYITELSGMELIEE